MCGRYSKAGDKQHLAMSLGLPETAIAGNIGEPNFNCRPETRLPVLYRESTTVPGDKGSLTLTEKNWGIVTRHDTVCINARYERLTVSPTWRPLFMASRVIIPMTGFYEWKTQDGASQPFYFTNVDVAPTGGFLLAAGLATPDAFVIVTITADPTIREVHPRMPLILGAGAWQIWLHNGMKDTTIGHGHSEEPCQHALSTAKTAAKVFKHLKDIVRGDKLITRIDPSKWSSHPVTKALGRSKVSDSSFIRQI